MQLLFRRHPRFSWEFRVGKRFGLRWCQSDLVSLLLQSLFLLIIRSKGFPEEVIFLRRVELDEALVQFLDKYASF